MKKGTLNTILILGAAAAAFFIFTSMRRRRSSVEAGPTEKITEAEYEAAEVEPAGGGVVKTAQSVIDIVKSLKRTSEQKAAAARKKGEKVFARAAKRKAKQSKRSTKMGELPVLY